MELIYMVMSYLVWMINWWNPIKTPKIQGYWSLPCEPLLLLTSFVMFTNPNDSVIPYPNGNLHSPGEQSVVVSGSLYQSWSKLKDIFI